MAEVNNQESTVQENEAKLTEDVQVEQQDEQDKKNDTDKYIALSSIMLGLLAVFTGIPVINIILGTAGVGSAVKSFKPGSRIFAAIGLIVSIVGSIHALGVTVYRFFPQIDIAQIIINWLSSIL